jgi:hypothetical protein
VRARSIDVLCDYGFTVSSSVAAVFVFCFVFEETTKKREKERCVFAERVEPKKQGALLVSAPPFRLSRFYYGCFQCVRARVAYFFGFLF